MSKVYKLSTIQQYVKENPINLEKLLIQPLEVNYLVEDKLSTREICDIYNYFKKSQLPLCIHLSLKNITDNCYIKLSEDDAKKLFS